VIVRDVEQEEVSHMAEDTLCQPLVHPSMDGTRGPLQGRRRERLPQNCHTQASDGPAQVGLDGAERDSGSLRDRCVAQPLEVSEIHQLPLDRREAANAVAKDGGVKLPKGGRGPSARLCHIEDRVPLDRLLTAKHVDGAGSHHRHQPRPDCASRDVILAGTAPCEQEDVLCHILRVLRGSKNPSGLPNDAGGVLLVETAKSRIVVCGVTSSGLSDRRPCRGSRSD
jgi:hypothetical protein